MEVGLPSVPPPGNIQWMIMPGSISAFRNPVPFTLLRSVSLLCHNIEGLFTVSQYRSRCVQTSLLVGSALAKPYLHRIAAEAGTDTRDGGRLSRLVHSSEAHRVLEGQCQRVVATSKQPHWLME